MRHQGIKIMLTGVIVEFESIRKTLKNLYIFYQKDTRIFSDTDSLILTEKQVTGSMSKIWGHC